MNNLRSRKFMTALSLLTASGLLAVSGYAQTTAAAPAKDSDSTVVLEKFEVTGSYIPAAADETKAMPVQVITTAEIAATGITSSVLDLLKKTVPQIQGANNIGVDNANTAYNSNNGGSQAALRNTDTLVLINGKRVASSPVAASGGDTFVDLNLIPISAVDRIEVLTDGASAIYGTDAVSGVINIIMKKDYTGAELDTHFSVTKKTANAGYVRERNVSAIAGASNKDTQVMVAAEWSKTDPLYESDFTYTNPYYGTPSYPGVINTSGGVYYNLKSGLNTPPAGPAVPFATLVANGTYVQNNNITAGFNLGIRPTFQSGLDKKIVDASVSHDVSSKLTVKADFIYASTATASVLNPQPVSATIASLQGDPGIPITDTSGLTIRNRFLSGPNRIYTTQNDFYRGTFDVVGKVNEYFNFDAYINYNDARQTNLNYNQILNSALLAGIASGNINLFAITQNPTTLAAANIYGTAVGIYESKLISYDLIANGKVLDIWSGEISYAAGVEFRKETLSATADYNSLIQPNGSSLWNNGTTINPFSQGDTIESQFAEIKVPITSPQNAIPGAYLLTLDGAVRHEIYSGGNTVTVPKYSVRYLPMNDDFGFRATFGKSFEAPPLYDLYGPSSSGFTSSPGGLNAYNSAGVATGTKFPNIQAQQASGSNASLTPQHAKSYTVGAIYSPKYVKGLEFTIDYYSIKQTDVIGAPASGLTMMQSVEQYGPASPFAPYVTTGNFANLGGHQVTAPGQVSTNLTNIYVLTSLVNIGGINQNGFDLHAKYRLPWDKYGRFTVETSWANLRTFFIKTGPTDPGTDYAGFADDGTLPHWRSYSSVDWTYKGFGATLGYTHIPKVPDMEGGIESAYNVLDLQTRFDLGEVVNPALAGLSVDLGCNNLTGQNPPLDSNVFGNPPFDGSAYSPFGRVWYVDLKYKF